jgi:hypothetical protein
MSAGTIFVLCLALGFVAFVTYMSRLAKRSREEEEAAEIRRSAQRAVADPEAQKPSMKRAS